MALFLLTLVLILLPFGCADSPSAPREAQFEITSINEGGYATDEYGDLLGPLADVTVKNVGDATGYNVVCYARAKDSEGDVLDTGFALFADGADIDPGESAWGFAIFYRIESWNDIGSVDYELSWLTR